MTEMSNRDALAELDRDNAERTNALEAQGAHLQDLAAGYSNTLLEHLLIIAGGQDALVTAQLDHSGRISRMLDEAERQVEARKARIEERKVRERLVLPGGIA